MDRDDYLEQWEKDSYPIPEVKEFDETEDPQDVTTWAGYDYPEVDNMGMEFFWHKGEKVYYDDLEVR